MSIASAPLQLPSAQFYLFLLPFTLQALLLNDAFPRPLSRLARLALLPITVYLSLSKPRDYGFEPREKWIGVNAVLAMSGLYCAAKGIEWGLARDGGEYRWRGFEEMSQEERADGGKGLSKELNGSPPTRNGFKTRPAPQPAPTSTYSIILSTLHLITSMRGAGYPFHSSSTRYPPPPYSAPTFLLRTLLITLFSHLGFIATASIITLPYARRLSLVSRLLLAFRLPNLGGYPLHCLTESLSYTAWGLSAWTGISLFHSLFTLLCLSIRFLATTLLPSRLRLGPPAFDSRAYSPLFERAWAPHGVRYYWATQWHQLLRRPFHYLAWDPVERAVRRLGGGKRLGKVMASAATFALTAWVHEFALSSALTSVPSHISPPRTSFLARYGSTIFFLLMWFGSFLEVIFTRLTGRKVGRLAGFVWGAGWQSLMGVWLYASWAEVGLTKAIPSVERWEWQRVVYPLMAVAPEPLWCKSL
ncbi:hypothetical protein BCR35DRAFT_301737 [Leucosporidium creatinivorum]|uniref:Wax synthase domain-containing protein n=1 Tax=Leucosporidium creatinivorum TaxID=106004 RepID=A0A1Y2FW20_9BASI|nr:hypothetical protein BCR35DRAFT_301737 [Leucosporidium creatinivorum]